MRAKSNTKWRADFDYFWKPRSIENQACSILSDCQYLGRITSVMIEDIEAVAMEGRDFEMISAEAFWQEKSLEQLAAEQNVAPVQRFEDLWGRGSDLWTDEDDFKAFLAASNAVQDKET
jgi:hypothetical protein